MKEIYLDNAATTLKKPDTVYEAVNLAIKNFSANPGRSGHHKSIAANREIFNVREKISNFFNVGNPINVAFTSNATESLNFAIKGAIKENSHVITTYFEHNSSLRPLHFLRDTKGIKLTYVKTFDEIEKNINSETKALVINHISNVNGTIQDIFKIGQICKKYNLLFILDVSQSAGLKKIDMKKNNISILCGTGHKSLMGIQGIGFICLNENIEIFPTLEGGTGSYSKLERQPLKMPEMLEAGTLNTPGILSLGAGIDFIEKIGIEIIDNSETKLINYFIDEVSKIPNIIVYKSYTSEQGNVFGINIKGIESSDLANILDEEFGIMVRAGFHCAPLAHKEIGTFETGIVRFSISYFTTKEEIDYTISALKSITSNL